MTESQVIKLKIDNDFKRLISPLSEEELCLLEQDLIRNGCREPLSVWNGTILDGHNRYEICTRLNIPFSVQRINLKNREEAIVWICVNQLGRRNIAEETRKYLIGKRYETEKILGAHNVASVNQYAKKELGAKSLPEDPFGLTASRTRERLAEEYNVSHATMLNYGHYSRALDSLSAVVPELPPKILSGEVRISQDNIVHLSKLTGSEVMRLKQLVSEDAYLLSSSAEIRRLFPPKQVKPPLSMPPGSIKDMPSYDPDAEISSLTLTIPSWVSSINRAKAAANLKNTTKQARGKLGEELTSLKETIDSILAAMKEVP
ncbi:hypothetical protein Psfp_03389 [Pelotomaculum sp. FP]|uniref:hypothetical protein n=1 Tax=Pelotomaculum sp. FP TaxID=261474 RepID=UPI0010661378|nr:hypothetical protein [Pelotomaculum sp. FP]TEB13849.1 hypothetical protein Psfp_03389 [Pelotomaculum sp. FP]